MNRKHAVSALLGLLLTGATGAILFETDGGVRWSAKVPASDRAIAARAEENLPPPFALPPVETAFKETVERPLVAAAGAYRQRGAGHEKRSVQTGGHLGQRQSFGSLSGRFGYRQDLGRFAR